MTDLGVIRQWCEICQGATGTWHDNGTERCVKHDGPDRGKLMDLLLDSLDVIE